MTRARVLTVAGLDPSGGAGVAADLAVFRAFGCHGMAVVAALTVQDSESVSAVHPAESRVVASQLAALARDCPARAAKCGLLGSATTVRELARDRREATDVPLVVDPILLSGAGSTLSDDATVRAMVEHLFPLATLVTPNAIEAESLSGIRASDRNGAEAAGRRLVELGARAVLVKGGHARGGTCADVLVERGRDDVRVFERPRIGTVRRVHGTGCALSAAIAASLANGLALDAAVELAGRYVHAAIAGAYATGSGALVLDLSVRVAGMPR